MKGFSYLVLRVVCLFVMYVCVWREVGVMVAVRVCTKVRDEEHAVLKCSRLGSSTFIGIQVGN